MVAADSPHSIKRQTKTHLYCNKKKASDHGGNTTPTNSQSQDVIAICSITVGFKGGQWRRTGSGINQTVLDKQSKDGRHGLATIDFDFIDLKYMSIFRF